MVPDSATLESLIAEGNELGFISGTAAVDLAAISVAWELAEAYVGTNLLTGTACDEMNWPDGWQDFAMSFKVAPMPRTRLISIDSVTVLDDECECSDPGDIKIVDARRGLVQFCACQGGCGVCDSLCGRGCEPWTGRVEVCYTCGIWDSLADMPFTVKSALWLLASWWAGVFTSGGADASSAFLQNWHSMDYGEGFDVTNRSSPLGSSPQAAAAATLLRDWRVIRAVAIRGWYPSKRSRGPG